MISVEEALHIVSAHASPLETERVTLEEAAGRTLREDVISPDAIPPFDNSAVDGYAVKVSDLSEASQSRPVMLTLKGVVGAGQTPERTLRAGEAFQIMTGAPLPTGTEAVVMIEQTRKLPDGRIGFIAPVHAGDNCRRAGEDLSAGQKILSSGDVLRPYDVGLCATVGRDRLAVTRKPRVAIVATGSELVPPGQPLKAGQIRASTGYALHGLIESAGGKAVDYGIVRDDPEETRRVLSEATSCDVILTCGGVSMGEFDYVRPAMEKLKITTHFWKVRQRPGKPLVFGTRERRLFFGLPGNPVSSLICFEIYVRPCLYRLLGRSGYDGKRIKVMAAESIAAKSGLHQFIRVRLEYSEGRWKAWPYGKQSSGVLSTLSAAHGLLEIPENAPDVCAGDEADVLILNERAVLDQL
jgi:molybdopterin molybdotransferase